MRWAAAPYKLVISAASPSAAAAVVHACYHRQTNARSGGRSGGDPSAPAAASRRLAQAAQLHLSRPSSHRVAAIILTKRARACDRARGGCVCARLLFSSGLFCTTARSSALSCRCAVFASALSLVGSNARRRAPPRRKTVRARKRHPLERRRRLLLFCGSFVKSSLTSLCPLVAAFVLHVALLVAVYPRCLVAFVFIRVFHFLFLCAVFAPLPFLSALPSSSSLVSVRHRRLAFAIKPTAFVRSVSDMSAPRVPLP